MSSGTGRAGYLSRQDDSNRSFITCLCYSSDASARGEKELWTSGQIHRKQSSNVASIAVYAL